MVQQRCEGGGRADGEEMGSRHVQVADTTGLADGAWEVRDGPCSLTSKVKWTDNLSGTTDSSVSMSGPWDRRERCILGSVDENNVWDRHLSAPLQLSEDGAGWIKD